MAGRKTIHDKIIDAALDLAQRKPWSKLGLEEIAQEAGCSFADLRSAFRSKSAILNGFVRRIDLAVFSGLEGVGEDSPRDRLFDVMMSRFDALQRYRPAVEAIACDLRRRPLTGVLNVPSFLNSMTWMLEAAGIRVSGITGAAKARGLALIYGDAFRVWLRDESEDLAATMARLDRDLAKAESLINSCCRLSKGSAQNAAVAQKAA